MNKQTSKTTLEATNDIKIAEEIIERVISLKEKLLYRRKDNLLQTFMMNIAVYIRYILRQ